jgi:phosphopantothenoylcysteine decarboxylase/phosphopantothenate--cysteine ligase
MGYAIAAEAARRGAAVVLVTGPSALPTPAGARRVDVETALEMRDAVHAELSKCTVFVAAAAVADFRPAARAEHKIKKESLGEDAGLTVELVRNPDILAEVGAASGRAQRIVVGFAAESQDVVAAARRKLERKRCDLVVANDVSRAGAGFDVDTNAVVFVWPGTRTEELPLLTKREVAEQLLDRIEQLRTSGAPQDTPRTEQR